MSAPRSYVLHLPGREVPRAHELEVDIVNEPDIVLQFYKIMKDAAKGAVNGMREQAAALEYDVVRLGVPGMFRDRADLQLTTNYQLNYNQDDIYVYGGCALALYDAALRGLKEKHGLNALEKRVRRKTMDIDMVWFPRIPDIYAGSGLIATSQSPAIIAMVLGLKQRIEDILSRYQDRLLSLFRVKLADRYEILTVDHFEVHHTHEIKPGVHSIKIKCKVNGVTLKLCDISIHDSGSSQLYNERYQMMNSLQPMLDDPAYCPPAELTPLVIHNKDILVPNLPHYCKQQLFTFGNMLRKNDFQKALVNFSRVVFVLYLLEPLHQSNRNRRNVKERIDVGNIELTIKEIHELINHVKDVFKQDIKGLCHRHPRDETLTMLCSPQKRVMGISSYSMLPRSEAAIPKQEHRSASYNILLGLQNRINTLIPMIESMEQANNSDDSFDSFDLLRRTYELGSVIISESIKVAEGEFRTPANHRMIHQQVEELSRKVDALYAEYLSYMQRLHQQSIRKVSTPPPSLSASASPFIPAASTTSSTSRPPRHPGKPTGQQSMGGRSMRKSKHRSLKKYNTRKNTNKN